MVRIVQPLLSEDEETALGRVLEYLSDEAIEYISLPPDQRENHIYRAVLTLRSVPLLGRPLFALGQTVSTPGALEAIAKAEDSTRDFLNRHESGDWGDVCREDWQSNDRALDDGSRLFSVYRTKLDERIWIITEADRSVTTVLLPSEY